MLFTRSVLLPFFFCSMLAAQTDRTLPASFTSVWGGNNGTGTVFGGTKGIMQGLYIAPMKTASRILAVGFRRNASATDYAALTLDIEVLLSSTTQTLTTLSSTFASNLSRDQAVVFTRAKLNIPARSANSSLNDWVVIPVNRPWLFGGPNLIVQIKKMAATWSSTGWRNDRCFATTNRGDAISFGKACGSATHLSASSSNYLPGTPVSLTLSGAPASQPALLFLGFDMGKLGPIPLPLDLKPFGIDGCWLRVAPFFTFFSPTDASGNVSLQMPIPKDSRLSGLTFGTQFLYGNPSANNPARIHLSNARNIQLGPWPCANRYVYDLFDDTKTTGTLQAGGPIVLLRTIP